MLHIQVVDVMNIITSIYRVHVLDDSTVHQDSLTQCHTAHQAFDLAEIAAANFISQIEDIEDCNFGLGPAQERKAPAHNGFWKSFSPSQ